MCGRFTQIASWSEVQAFSRPLGLLLPECPPEPGEHYNIAPSQAAWTIIAYPEGGEIRHMRWGLMPHWAKDARLAWSTFNARVETAATKPAFRAAWKERRCLVPAGGYYEWREENGIKQPYYIHAAKGPLLMFAGLWEPARGEHPETFSILTRQAEGEVSSLHDRMPLMLEPAFFHDWLHGSAQQAGAMAVAATPPALAFHAVRRAVGNPRSQGPGLIEPA
jgi:putative SOS response-associated peptidase YedK